MTDHTAAAPALRALPTPLVLWRFGRPHTVVGSVVSVLGIFVIAAEGLGPLPTSTAAFHLGWTLVAAVAVNVFIVGLNPLEDVEIDRINKPNLPLAAGDMTMGQGRAVVAAAAVLPIVLAVTQGWIETAAVVSAMAIGAAYSSPPLRLKRYPAVAAASISIVRSVVVNLGVYLHFSGAFGGGHTVDPAVWALTAFVLPFSFAIAVLKDVPDVEGDRRHRIFTFTVRLGARTAFRIGLVALTVAYAGMAILGPLLVDDAQPVVLFATHVVALGLLWSWAARVDLSDRDAVTSFYLRVWVLFFCEYVVVPLAVVLG